jgi:hypothetical protein
MFDSAEETPMTIIRIVGRIDSEHRLTATVPESVPAGSVEVVLIVPEAAGDPADQAWETGIAREWSQDLADSRQDIYSLDDGEPVDDAG